MRNRFLQWSNLFSWLGVICLAGLLAVTQVQAGSTTPEDAEPGNTEAGEPEQDLRINSPGSIAKRLEEDAEPKEYLFQFPGLDRVMKPWYAFKDDPGETRNLAKEQPETLKKLQAAWYSYASDVGVVPMENK